jgi:putative zinc finger/helix-turn-helix YgiT family protein
MFLVCPNCGGARKVEPYKATARLKVRGEDIEVEVNLFKCKVCGEIFEDPEHPQDEIDKIYRKYRDNHGLLQPAEIKLLRMVNGLTIEDLSELTGIDVGTLLCYENGALQTEDDDDKIIRAFKRYEKMMNKKLED